MENKYVLNKEEIGKKCEGLNLQNISKKKFGALALAVVMTLSGCNTKTNEEQQTTTMSTTATSITTTVPETTTTKEFTTTAPKTTTVTTEAPVTTTPEIVVTKASTTKEEVIVTTEAKKTEATTTTTSAPKTTTVTTTKEEIKIEPVEIKNLSKKVEILKEELSSKGIYASEEMIEDLIRVLHCDFIEHDSCLEITAVKYEQAMQLLATIGSYNNVVFGAKYMGYIPEIEDTLYLPTEIMPTKNKDYLKKFEKLVEIYKKELNKIEMTQVTELTDEEAIAISDKVFEKLDKMNIQDPEQWSKEYETEYNKLYMEKLEEKQQAATKGSTKSAKEAYKEFNEDVMALINTDDYLELTAGEKMILFTTISGAMTSGMNEKYVEKYEEFEKGINASLNELREILMVANRKNKNQQEVIEEVIRENKTVSKQEREDLQQLLNKVDQLEEDGKKLTR